MKLRHCLVLAVALLASAYAVAQPSNQNQSPPATAQKELTKFNLDFPGGTPGELVAAIEKATGRPLNAIIPTEDAERQLPPLKMRNVNVVELFNALKEATRRYVHMGHIAGESQLGFQSPDNPADDSIWYFFVRQLPRQPSEAKFYLLTPYLEHGLTVDDITTAIQTAWKMQGGTRPTMSFHKETNLLIAVGDQMGLRTIELALQALEAYKSAADSASKSDEKKE
jgi:hypothetical protein